MEPHSFYNQLNVLTSIIQHNSSSDHFKLLDVYSSKLCKFKIKYFDNMAKMYRSSRLKEDKQQHKRYVKLGIVSTQKQLHYLNHENLFKIFTSKTQILS